MKREGRAAEMAECAVRVVREREYRGMARKLRPQTMHTSEGCSLHSCRGEGALCNCVYSRVKKTSPPLRPMAGRNRPATRHARRQVMHPSSPEQLPPVAYETDAVAPTLFGCCQRRWSVGSGGAENTNWRTQVFRAILERQCVLESERGSACVTRETRKQVGVRLEPLHFEVHVQTGLCAF